LGADPCPLGSKVSSPGQPLFPSSGSSTVRISHSEKNTMADPANSRTRFRWPAEWAPHRATWLAWPHERSDWPGKFPTIPWVFAEIVRHLAQAERVGILVGDTAEERRARRILARNAVDQSRIDFRRIPTDRVWTRDFGPIFVTAGDGAKVALDW